jgi:hypothetical protein
MAASTRSKDLSERSPRPSNKIKSSAKNLTATKLSLLLPKEVTPASTGSERVHLKRKGSMQRNLLRFSLPMLLQRLASRRERKPRSSGLLLEVKRSTVQLRQWALLLDLSPDFSTALLLKATST